MRVVEPGNSALRGERQADLLAIARVLMDNAPFGVALLDEDLRFLRLNEALAALLGLPRDEHFGRSITDVIPRLDPAAIERMRRVLATGEPLMNQEEITGSRRPSGRRRYWMVSYQRVEREAGGRGLVVVIQEISDRKEVEARERQVRRDLMLAAGHVARLQAVTSALSEARTPSEVSAIAVTQGVAALGGGAGSMMVVTQGGDEIELLAVHGVPDGIPERFRRFPLTVESPHSRAIRTASPEWIETHEEYATSYPAVAGKIASPSLSQAIATIPLVLHGAAIGSLCISFTESRRFDDTERYFALTLARQCAQALDRARLYEAERRANERLTIVAEVSAMLAASLDSEATLASVPRACVPRFADVCSVELLTADGQLSLVALIHNDRAKEAKIRETRLLYPPDPERSAAFRVMAERRAICEGRASDEQLAAVAEDAEHLERLRETACASHLIAPIVARGKAVGVILFGREDRAFDSKDELALAEDIARRAGLAIDNAKLYSEVQEASRSKDEFLSVLSHELRTPLNAILGWAAILGAKMSDPDSVARGIEVIERNARAQVKIIEDILDVSRIITGKLRLDSRALDFDAVVRASVEVFGPAAEAKPVEITCELPSYLPRILGDPDRLQQVVWNLLSNAVKFTPKGGRVEIHVERASSAVLLRVSDTGPGIRPDFLPYVFDRFRQADSSSSRAHGGLGLGLAIVRHLVEMHGGSVAVESPGALGGATFTVTLPVPDDDLEGAMAGARISFVELAAASIPSNVSGLRVLLVDDEDDSRELMVSILRAGGADVQSCESAAKAFEALARFRPDVLVSDIGMPDEDGYSFLRRVRALPPPLGRVPAVALTAYARPEDARKAFLAGFQMHVPKPVEPSALATVVANLGGRVALGE